MEVTVELPTEVDEELTVAAPPRLDPDALYGPVGELVCAIAPHTEAHPAGLLAGLLAACGAIIGPGPHQDLDGSRHGVNLFVTLVGPSADGRKGTVSAWVKRVVKELNPDFHRSNITGGLSTGEGLIFDVRDASPPPRAGKDGDPGVSDKRCLVIADELGGTFRRMSARENTLSYVLREAWDGGNLRTLTRREPMQATAPHIALFGSLVPEELTALTTDSDFAGGTLNRILFVWVERTRLLPRGGGKPQFTSIVNELRGALSKANTNRTIEMTEEAALVWDAAYPRLTSGRSGRFGQATRRAAPIVRRLAALYALTNGHTHIAVTDMRAALALWQYGEDTARYIFRTTELSALGTRFIAELEDAPGGLTRTDLRRINGSNNTPAKTIYDALLELQRSGLARQLSEPTAGRSRERWFSTTHFFAHISSHGNNGNNGRQSERDVVESHSVAPEEPIAPIVPASPVSLA